MSLLRRNREEINRSLTEQRLEIRRLKSFTRHLLIALKAYSNKIHEKTLNRGTLRPHDYANLDCPRGNVFANVNTIARDKNRSGEQRYCIIKISVVPRKYVGVRINEIIQRWDDCCSRWLRSHTYARFSNRTYRDHPPLRHLIHSSP